MIDGRSTFYIVRPFEVTEANMASNLEYFAPAEWVGSHAFAEGYPLVHFSGVLYKRIGTGGASTSLDPPSNPTKWQAVTGHTNKWQSGTTYAKGDQVFMRDSAISAVQAFPWGVYESLVNANTGNDPFTSPSQWVLKQTVYEHYNSERTYSGGGHWATFNRHDYSNLITTTGDQPDISPSDWLPHGPSTVWAPFDDKTGTQATITDELTYTFTVTGRIDTIAFINIAAANINITINDGTSDVYDEDFNLVSTEEIYDWYTYFLEEATTRDRLYVSGLPAVLDPTITITLTGDAVAVGLIVIGRAREVGETKAGGSIGIQDFSIKQQDGFGGYTFAPRGFNDQGDFSVSVPTAWVDGLRRVLSDIRATPTLFIGTEDYTSTYYYGICTWSISFDYYQRAVAKIEITGL